MPATETAEWVLSEGLLVGIGYTCVRSRVSGGQRGRPWERCSVRSLVTRPTWPAGHALTSSGSSTARTTPSPAELTDPDARPLRGVQDLSIADDRFEPLLIEAAVRHIGEAREQSSDGSDAPLLAVASGAGAHALSFPSTGAGRHARRLELVWTLELDEATHRHPRWRLTHSRDTS